MYSPHAKFVLVAGFGNLQGTVDVYDRQNKFSRVVTFEASNTSVCEWSPCGRFILTATTSPRLRVDNGCKIWHASGKLVYLKEYPELYSIGWKPQALDQFHQSKLWSQLQKHIPLLKNIWPNVKPQQVLLQKPTGAYRPPHARGSGASAPASSLYQKELQNNMRNNGTPPPPGLSRNGLNTPRVRTVVGAAPPVEKESKAAAKNRKREKPRSNKKRLLLLLQLLPHHLLQLLQLVVLLVVLHLWKKRRLDLC